MCCYSVPWNLGRVMLNCLIVVGRPDDLLWSLCSGLIHSVVSWFLSRRRLCFAASSCLLTVTCLVG